MKEIEYEDWDSTREKQINSLQKLLECDLNPLQSLLIHSMWGGVLQLHGSWNQSQTAALNSLLLT